MVLRWIITIHMSATSHLQGGEALQVDPVDHEITLFSHLGSSIFTMLKPPWKGFYQAPLTNMAVGY